MLRIPMLDLKAQYDLIKKDVLDNLNRVLESQQFILGPEVEALEKQIAEYSQCKYAIGVSSGTDALLASLMACGIKTDDEIITTPYSFFSTAGSIARLGALPVFTDISPKTLNMDPEWIERLITPKTKAIIPVHFGGQVADMEPILEIARKYGLFVIEDACQAIGAEYKGQRAGSIGSLGCFSFFPSKNLGGYGDSGMITTNDPILADKLTLIRNHGHKPKYYNKIIGGNFRMDALQAAVLRAKFKHLDDWIRARRNHAQIYHQLFHQYGITLDDDPTYKVNESKVVLPIELPICYHTYHLYIIRLSRRDQLADFLKKMEISTEIYYPVPLHLQECFSYLNYEHGDLPISEQITRESLALPIYPELSYEMLDAVVKNISVFCGV